MRFALDTPAGCELDRVTRFSGWCLTDDGLPVDCLWLRVNGKDVDNSNCEQSIPTPGFTTVMVSQGVNALKKGDKVEAMYSGSAPGLGIVFSKPDGEPAVPSIIFSLFKLD